MKRPKYVLEYEKKRSARCSGPEVLVVAERDVLAAVSVSVSAAPTHDDTLWISDGALNRTRAVGSRWPAHVGSSRLATSAQDSLDG